MATTTSSAALVPVAPVFTNTERLALAGFLAGYSGLTRQAYELDLRQYASWCQQHQLRLFRPAAPTSNASPATWRPAAGPGPPSPAGCAPSPGSTGTRSRKTCSIIRRPRMCAGRGWTTSRTPPALDRNELGALLVAAGLGPPAEHALISLLALNGLRVSEAIGADIEALGVERGHRTLVITRKGGKVVTIPLAPRTARAIDLAVGERSRRADLPGRRRAAAGPARRSPDRPPHRPPGRDRQECRAAHAAACVHHRRAGRRSPAARRTRSRLARRPAYHDEV